jgi:hypothetical protein
MSPFIATYYIIFKNQFEIKKVLEYAPIKFLKISSIMRRIKQNIFSMKRKKINHEKITYINYGNFT